MISDSIDSADIAAEKRAKDATRMREWCAKNREVARARCRKYYDKNRERMLIRAANYRDANRDKIRAYAKNHYDTHSEQIAAYRAKHTSKERLARYGRNYRKSERGKAVLREQKARRRAVRNGCKIVEYGLMWRWSQSWRSKSYVKCYWCGRRKRPKGCHDDHIIPLAKGGEHSITNLCISCAPCNKRKSASTLPEWNAKIPHPVLL